MVFITHDLAEALKLGDHVVIMRDGADRADRAARRSSSARPADDYVNDFVRDIPKSHVLTLRWVMRDRRRRTTPSTARTSPAATVIRTRSTRRRRARSRSASSTDGELVGVVDRAQILEAIADRSATRIVTAMAAGERRDDDPPPARDGGPIASGAWSCRPGVAAVVLYVVFHGQWTARAHDDDAALPVRSTASRTRSPTTGHNPIFEVLFGITALVDTLSTALTSALARLAGAVIAAGALGLLFGGVRLAAAARVGARLRVRRPRALGRRAWTPSPALAAVVIALACIGLPLGISAGRSDRRQRDPVADPRRDADHADARVPGADRRCSS